MRSYVVMLPAAAARAGGTPRPEDWRLLPDGFSKLALVFPVLWLLVHRLWLAAGLAFLVPAAASLAAGVLPADGATLALVYPLVSLAVGVVVGMEGRAAVIARAERRGARTVGVIEARSRAEAEDKLAALATMGAPERPDGPGPGPDAAPVAPPPRRYGRARGAELIDAPRAPVASLVPLGGR